jgi:type I restriction enzyme S subunit
MSGPWQTAQIGTLLAPTDEWVQIEPDHLYREVTVKLWGKGVVMRREIAGTDVQADKRRTVHSGEFILSRIDARNGATGIVPPELDGAIVSNDFPSFRANPFLLDPAYLSWLSKTESFVDLCRQASEGTTNRVRLREDRFLVMEILLPPLPEQRRVVARLEKLDEKLAEVTKLHLDSLARSRRIRPSVALQLMSGRGESSKALGEGMLSTTNGLSRRPDGNEEGPPVLRLADVASGAVDLSQVRRHSLSNGEQRNYCLEQGDLLFVRVNGSREIVGRCIPFLGANETICFNDHLIRVRVDPKIWDWRYINETANSPLGRSHFETVAITTAGQHTINHRMLSAMPLPAVSLSEQAKFAERLAWIRKQITELVTVQNRAVSDTGALLKLVISQAFTSERSKGS